MEKQKRFISLWNLETKYVAKPMVAILGLIAFIQGFFMIKIYCTTDYVTTKVMFNSYTESTYNETQPWFYRFESLLQLSHVKLTFSIGLGLVLLTLLLKGIRQGSGSNSDIMIRRLPVRMSSIVKIRIVHNMVMLFLYVAANFLLIIVWNIVYHMVLPSNVQMTNSLSLSFLRWNFLRKAYPINDGVRLITDLCILIFLAVHVEYITFMQKRQEQKYLVIVPCLLLIYFMFQTDKVWKLVIMCSCLVLVSACSCYQIRKQILLERGKYVYEAE